MPPGGSGGSMPPLLKVPLVVMTNDALPRIALGSILTGPQESSQLLSQLVPHEDTTAPTHRLMLRCL